MLRYQMCKKTVSDKCLFVLLGRTRIKFARKTWMKLTPGGTAAWIRPAKRTCGQSGTAARCMVESASDSETSGGRLDDVVCQEDLMMKIFRRLYGL